MFDKNMKKIPEHTTTCLSCEIIVNIKPVLPITLTHLTVHNQKHKYYSEIPY